MTKLNELSTFSIPVNQDGKQPTVSSVDVAEHFQKGHKNVLREIQRLRSMLPKSFSGLNFEPSNYIDGQGKERPAFNLTRDGFSMLAMGFTGKTAVMWKLKYIEAFNALELNAMKTARLEGVTMARSLSPWQKDNLDRVIEYKRMGLKTKDVAKLLDCCKDTVQRTLRAARAMGAEV